MDGCSLAFNRGRKHMLPMGTACTGPESLKISVAISLAFLPAKAALSQTCCKHTDNKLRKPSRERSEAQKETETSNHRQRDEFMKEKMVGGGEKEI